MGQGKLIKHMAGKVSDTKGRVFEGKGSPGVKTGFSGLGKGLATGGFSGEKQVRGKGRRGLFGGVLGGGTMRMAGSVGQKKEECE